MIRRLSLGGGLALAATAIVAVSVMVGLFLIDNPATERRQRIDMQRVRDLDRLAEMVDCYWTLQKRLPADLQELVRGLEEYRGRKPLPFQCRAGTGSDPVTGEPYPYRVLDEKSFELCANFAAASEDEALAGRAYLPGSVRRDWSHSAGRVCFSRTASLVKPLSRE